MQFCDFGTNIGVAELMAVQLAIPLEKLIAKPISRAVLVFSSLA